MSSGKRKQEKETWWWNEEVQESIQRKRLVKKKWDKMGDEESRQAYKVTRQEAKREVAKAKERAVSELY